MKPDRANAAFVGRWRIVEMETWEADYVDMDEPAYFAIRANLTGEFQFGLVQGDIDGRLEVVDGAPRLSFSWSGFDENDPIGGRGWLMLQDGSAVGHLFVPGGNDSGFKAARQPP